MGISVSFSFLKIVIGIWVCFLFYGYLQEYVWRFKDDNGVTFSWALLFILMEHSLAAIFARVAMKATNTPSRSIRDVAKPMFFVCLAQGLSKFAANECLKHVSFVVQVLAKSSKTIPSILGSVVGGRRFTLVQYSTAFLIAFATCSFSLIGHTSGSLVISTVGGLLVCLSLVADGWVSAEQTKLAQKMPLSSHENMYYTNLGSFILVAVLTCMEPTSVNGFWYIWNNPTIMVRLLGICLASAIGQLFIFESITKFGHAETIKITSMRKLLSVLASIGLYRYSISFGQVITLIVVFLGLFLEIAHNSQQNQKSKTK